MPKSNTAIYVSSLKKSYQDKKFLKMSLSPYLVEVSTLS